MAYHINTDCISCGACAAECPVSAISEGDNIYVIDPDTCIGLWRLRRRLSSRCSTTSIIRQ